MPAGQLVPALQSYWIAIHVTAMILAIGTYIFGAVVTVLYLLVSRYERQVAAGETSAAAGIWDRLPGSEVLDRLAYRAILFAFPAWTFAVIAGAIWADHAWGRYWGWDPKETWSFITWLVYAAFLHARATAGWRGPAGRVHPAVRLRLPAVQPGRREPVDHRPALVRGHGLTPAARRFPRPPAAALATTLNPCCRQSSSRGSALSLAELRSRSPRAIRGSCGPARAGSKGCRRVPRSEPGPSRPAVRAGCCGAGTRARG